MKHLFYVYRFIGTSLFWFFFGVIGLIYGFLLLPLVYVFARQRDRRQVIARNMIRGAFVMFVWVARNMRLITCDIRGMEHWNPSASQLLLANHLTLIDVVILLSLFPQVDCVVKAAVIHLSRCAAMELGEDNVRVNSISPGAIATGIFAKAAGLDDEAAEAMVERTSAALANLQAIPRAGLPDDIANAAVYLGSDEAGFVNGEDIVIDGGLIWGRHFSEVQASRRALNAFFD